MDANTIIEFVFNNPVIPHILVGVVRSVAGYVENCVEAKKLLPFEFSKTMATLFRVGVQSAGLGALGLPPMTALVSDKVISAVKKK